MINKKMQNKDLKFDLFKLHVPEEDKDPKWSWIRASGKDLSPLVYSLIKELTNKNGTNNTAKKIKKLVPRLSLESILNYFWSKYERFPLVFLEALSEQFKNSMEIKQKIQDKIEILSISRYDSKPIKSVRKLSLTLCKIAGAHAADGSLWGEYNYQLIDGDRLAVMQFSKWLEEVFGYKINPVKTKGKNSYHVYFKSRIIGRYLNKFLDFPIGRKCEIVKEPIIIRKSPVKFRKAFALGVMTFDGGVDCRGMAALSGKSKGLVGNVHQILIKDQINVSPLKYFQYKEQYYFQSNYRDPKLLQYFDNQSSKWYRLYELVYGFQGKIKTLKEAKMVFNKTYSKVAISKVSFSDIIDIIINMDIFTNKEIILKLKEKNIEITSSAIGVYLHLLRNAKIIHPFDDYKAQKHKVDNKNVRLNNNFRGYFFKEVMRKFEKQQELGDFLKRIQSVISNYIYGRRSIPLYDLKKMAKVIKIAENTLNKNIIKTTQKTPTFRFYKINKNVKEWRVPWRPYLTFVEDVKNEKR